MLGSDIYLPLHPDTLADPFPVFRRLQQEAPVVWHEKIFAWVVSRYSDCSRVLRYPAEFSRDPAKLLGLPAANPERMTIQSHDPPHPTPLRQALTVVINRLDIAAICHEAGQQLERCLSQQPAGLPFDFMSQAAAPTALRFACRLIGVPMMPVEVYDSIFVRVTRAMDSSLEPRRRKPGVEATKELHKLITEAYASAAPGSIIHELKRLPAATKLSAGYVRNTVSAMFNAAYSTAHTSMGSFLVLAMARPGLAQRIADSGEVAAGVQELLRFTSPAQATMRYAACDVVLSGAKIRKKAPVVTLMAAANRDPEHFEHPDDLVLDRSPNPHLGFGWGPHFCIGASLGQAFLGHFVRRLADWESELALAGEPSWLDTATLRCLHHLPIVRRSRVA